MANQVRIGVGVPGAKQSASELDRLRDKFDKLQKQGAKGFAIGAGAGLALNAVNALGGAVSTVTDFMGDSVKAASNLNETVSKTRTIFGASSREIEQWADTAAESFGQSKRQALDTAAGFAGLFDTVGISLAESSEMAKKLTVLGSDLASFFNTDVQTAIDSLRSGLSGESEPLRKFNVFLSETAVKAKLAEMGIKGVGGKFTEAQKATARYQLILEQTTTAQGDFGRTSDGLANKQRIATSRMEEASAELGQKLLPAMLAATEAGISLVGVIGDIGDIAGAVVDPVATLVDEVKKLPGDPTGAEAHAFWDQFFNDIRAAEAATETFGDTSYDTIETMRSLRTTGVEAGSSVRGLGDEADDTVDALDPLLKRLEDAAEAARDFDDAIDDLSSRLYDSEVTAGDLAEAQQELADLMNDAPEFTRPGDWTIYQGKLAEAEKKVFDLEYALAQLAGDDAILAWLYKQKEQVDKNNTSLQAQIDKLIRIHSLGKTTFGGITFTGIPTTTRGTPTVTGTRTPSLTGRASGGPVAPNTAYRVGERGEETLVMGSQGGHVIPNGGASGSSGPLRIELVLPTGGVLTPAQGADIARQIGPHLVEYLNRRGYGGRTAPTAF